MQKETRKIKANLTEDIVNGPMFVSFFTITLLDELASAPMAISMSASNGEMCRLNLALISMFSVVISVFFAVRIFIICKSKK